MPIVWKDRLRMPRSGSLPLLIKEPSQQYRYSRRSISTGPAASKEAPRDRGGSGWYCNPQTPAKKLSQASPRGGDHGNLLHVHNFRAGLLPRALASTYCEGCFQLDSVELHRRRTAAQPQDLHLAMTLWCWSPLQLRLHLAPRA